MKATIIGIASKASFAALLVATVPSAHGQSQTPPSAPMTVVNTDSMSTHSSNDTIGGGALIVTSTANGVAVPHGVLQVADLPGNERTGAGSAAVRIYVDPGTEVYYDIYVGDLNFNDASHLSSFQVSFSGYLTSSP